MVTIDNVEVQPQQQAPEPEKNSGPIDSLAVQTAQQTLEKYISGKQELDRRIIANEDWWKLQHWKNFHRDNM